MPFSEHLLMNGLVGLQGLEGRKHGLHSVGCTGLGRNVVFASWWAAAGENWPCHPYSPLPDSQRVQHFTSNRSPCFRKSGVEDTISTFKVTTGAKNDKAPR